MGARHNYYCICSDCEAKRAAAQQRKLQLQEARREAARLGEVYVLPASKRTKPESKLGKRAKRIGRIRALSSPNHGLALSVELRMLWDSIPQAVRQSATLCHEKHVLQDCLTFCSRKPVVQYRETPLADFQAVVYRLWQSTHRDSYGFFETSHILDVYSNSQYDIADKEQKHKRKQKRAGHPLPDYAALCDREPFPDTRSIVYLHASAVPQY